MRGSVGHLGGGLGAWGGCKGGASSPQLLGSPPALAGHHHGTDEGHQHYDDEPHIHLGGCVRTWGWGLTPPKGGALAQPHNPPRSPVLGTRPALYHGPAP